MLTVGEILEKVDTKYPNAHSFKQKISMINELQKNLFRTIYRVKSATVFDIIAGVYLYQLDFHHSKIISAIVDGKHIDYEDINDEKSGTPFLYTFGNALGIYPTPQRDVSSGLFIHHYLEPKKLTNESDIPEFDPDFHMMLVYGVCIELAEDSNDVDMVNNFTSKYNGLLDDFKKSKREPVPPTFRIEY